MYRLHMARQALVVCVITVAALAGSACAGGYTRVTTGSIASFAPDLQRSLVDVIARTWPNVTNPPWQSRSTMQHEPDRIGVYANGQLLGGLDAIRDVPAWRAANVRRMTPVEERMRFGRQHAAGALVIEWVKQ